MQRQKPESRQLKERVPLGLSKQKRSPYALQYLQFQRRLDSKKGCRLPSIASKSKNVELTTKMNNEQYLALAKHLKSNKEQIFFCEDKENNFGEIEEISEDLTEMKGIIDKMKIRYGSKEDPGRRRLSELQYSQQIKDMGRLQSRESSNHRSRALSNAVSNALNPLKEIDQNAKIKFLDYKKGKRELPSWMKYD